MSAPTTTTAGEGAGLLPGDALPRARTVLRLLPVLRRHPTAVALTVLTAAGNQLFGIAAVTVAAWLTGQVAVLGGVPAGAADRDRLVTALWWLGVLVLGKAALAWAESWVAHDLAYRVMVDLRLEVYDGLERLAPAWLLGRRSGDVAAAALSDVEALEWFYAHTVAQLAVTVLTPAGALAVMATIEPRLAAVLLPFVVAVATVPLWLLRRGDAQGVALRTSLAGLHADTADAVAGLREVIAFGAQRHRSDRLRAAGRRLARAQRAEAWRNGLENGVTEAMLALAVVAVLATGSVLVRDGQLGPAQYPVVTVLAGLALAPITLLTNGIRNLGVLRATASRVAAVADTRPRVEDPADADPPVPADPGLRLEAVRFGYLPGTAVLDGVDLTVPHGATVALVGRSGAGKSTVAHLVLRFWDVDDGRVTLGGVDIRRLRQSTLRRLVALVPQDPYLFHGTISDNIRLGRPDASDVEVRAVAEQCLVTEFTDRLPGGLDAVVGERGATLSGGQRQRVALARALLPDPAVLVLDEPVSNLDAEGEAQVQQALERARRGRTTLVIAHRLSTVIGADAVAVLDRGSVVESGAPADLAAGGAFRDLFADQWATDD